MLEEKFEENPNLRGAIRDITANAPIGPSEVGLSEVEADLLQLNFNQNERANLYLEWNGIKNEERYPTFESYIRHILDARKMTDKLQGIRREIEIQQEEERMRF